MKTRRIDVGIMINNQKVVEEIMHHMTSFTYTDPASGEADNIQLEFEDIDRKWLNENCPKKMDLVSGAIFILHKNKENDYEGIETGALLVDAFSFRGHPNTMSMSCISTPINSSFKESKNSKTYENATFKTICSDIASRNNLKLETNVDDFVISSIEQKKQTDADFISGLCNDYGICIKIYTNKLIIFDREKYKSDNTIRTFKYNDIKSYDYNTQIEGSYDGGEYTYKDPITGAEIIATYGSTAGRILKASGNASSIADAERKIKGQVLNANHSITTLNITIQGEIIYSTQCVKIEGLGVIDGKYYINKATHNVSGGYTTTLNLSKCK